MLDCISKLFQVKMGSFTGVTKDSGGNSTGQKQDGSQLSLNADGTTYSTQDLSRIHQNNGGSGNVTGMTLDGFNWTRSLWGGFFSYTTSYVGSDLTPFEMVENQIHELGHQLGQATGKADLSDKQKSEKLATDLQDCYNQKK